MHPFLRPLYAGAASLATQAAPVVASALATVTSDDHKLVRSLRARVGVLERWEALTAQRRDVSRPLVWMHAPSVGEGLQARPVAHALRERHPGVQLAYSWFSPSAERFAESIGADLCDYLPFDTRDAADRLLHALTPSVLVFSKLDIWPTLAERAAVHGIPVILLSGTVAPGSGRRGLFARALLHDAYRALSAVGAIDDIHGERLVELGVRRDVLEVTGDTRFDQVWLRAQGVNTQAALLQRVRSQRPTLVAGSTWPADEAVLLPAWDRVRTARADARLIIAPHEPTAAHNAPIIAWANARGLTLTTLSALEQEEPVGPRTAASAEAGTGAGTEAGATRRADRFDVILIDRVGVLGDLYGAADLAFVGGGFHSAGLHSVIEPAAFGVPVLFGPGHEMSREAGLLLADGAAEAVTDIESLCLALQRWLSSGATRDARHPDAPGVNHEATPEATHGGDQGAKVAAGLRARAVVERERGATARALAIIERVLARDARFRRTP